MHSFVELMRELQVEQYLTYAFSTFIISLGVVYISGRMLGFTRTYKQRNTVAFVTIIIVTAIYTVDFIQDFIPRFIKDFLFIMSSASVLYTLIGMKLFNRINKVQDDLADIDIKEKK